MYTKQEFVIMSLLVFGRSSITLYGSKVYGVFSERVRKVYDEASPLDLKFLFIF